MDVHHLTVHEHSRQQSDAGAAQVASREAEQTVRQACRAPNRIALVAHDAFKHELVDWVRSSLDVIGSARILTTSTTGRVLQDELGIPVERVLSGPMGGDLQIAAMIAEKQLDCLIFFWDPATVHAHEADVKALIRIAALQGIPMALNRATAELIITAIRADSAREGQAVVAGPGCRVARRSSASRPRGGAPLEQPGCARLVRRRSGVVGR